MSYASFLQLATLISGVAMSLSPIFQIKLILQRKSSADVAIGWPLVILVGVIIWLLNGIYLHSTAIIVSEVIGIITNSLAVGLILFYRESEGVGGNVFLTRIRHWAESLTPYKASGSRSELKEKYRRLESSEGKTGFGFNDVLFGIVGFWFLGCVLLVFNPAIEPLLILTAAGLFLVLSGVNFRNRQSRSMAEWRGEPYGAVSYATDIAIGTLRWLPLAGLNAYPVESIGESAFMFLTSLLIFGSYEAWSYKHTEGRKDREWLWISENPHVVLKRDWGGSA